MKINIKIYIKMRHFSLMRHLYRIDCESSNNIQQERKWYKEDYNDKNFKYNPYLSDRSYELADKVVSEISEEIDTIVTSPFLRCIQTAFIMRDKLNQKQNTNITTIYVHFGLSEIVNYYTTFYGYSIDESSLKVEMNKIFEFSLSYLSEEQRKDVVVIFSSPEFFYNEDNDSYTERIRSAFYYISEKFKDNSVLAVGHRSSHYLNIEYGQVHNITNNFLEI